VSNQTLENVKRFGTGLAFILYPLFSGLAFAVHPNLLSLEFGGPVSDKVAEFHNNDLMHFGHFVMTLGVPLLIVIAAKLMRLLRKESPWLGFIGGLMGGFGAILLAIDKTALCLVMSAFDTLPEAQFVALLPGIEALFHFKGYIAILYLLPLLPLGFLVQGIGLYRARVLPRWQSGALIVAMLGLGVASAVDIDIFGLVATVILAAGFIPLGIQIIRGRVDG
jgi:hypothetical protein